MATQAVRAPGLAECSEAPRLLRLVILQFICKFPYLFFPRYIHHAFGIVVKAFARQIHKPRFEFCPFRHGPGDCENLLLRTRQSAPAERIRTIQL